ncbi:MAG: presqualene diphosphate synthase HpnD [Gammaproteobacteria bacterium]|nr:presqualene diphosphate synthase HpnD [Gammaproteobacteria bacterium]
MTPEAYCQQKTRQSGSSFYYSFFFLSPPRRRAITALYAFCREVDDVVDDCEDPQQAQQQLAEWREEIARLYRGEPQHPVGLALLPVIASFDLSQEHFLEIIDGMEMDLHHQGFANFAQLSLYCYRVASVVGLMSATIFGYQDRQTLKYAHDLGMAFQLTNILRDVGEDARRGRCYLPADEMARFGVTRAQLEQGQWHAGMRELFVLQAERAERYYQQAFERLPEVDRHAQLCGLLMVRIYHTVLVAIREADYPVLQRRISLSSGRKLGLALQAAWQEWRRARAYRRQQG